MNKIQRIQKMTGPKKIKSLLKRAKEEGAHMEKAQKFEGLLKKAREEGAIGVEEERLVHRTLKKPSLYRAAVKEKLTNADASYVPHTYALFEELYTLTIQ
tara:strand:- start:176 stop:475 length:300 start_codon:yes stop_codon:yes gene_type:complete